MKIGIVGMPNAGKSTLFNALTAAGAETGDYPFTTVEPNVAIVPVPDERLDRIGDALGIAKRVPEHIEFVDIAGLVRGAHQGEGLGNRFLGHIQRESERLARLVAALLLLARIQTGQEQPSLRLVDPAPLLTGMHTGSSPKNSSSTPSLVPFKESGMTGNLSLPRCFRTSSA